MSSADGHEQVEYNRAEDHLREAGFFLMAAEQASIEMDAHNWCVSLCAANRHLVEYMKDDEIKEFMEAAKNIMRESQKQNKDNQSKGFNTISEDLYWKLNDFDIKLRLVLKKAGAQRKLKEDETFTSEADW